jgi:hypothetical protein
MNLWPFWNVHFVFVCLSSRHEMVVVRRSGWLKHNHHLSLDALLLASTGSDKREGQHTAQINPPSPSPSRV